jgi:hypothetical protein
LHFEKQIQRIAHRSELVKFVNQLPDNAKVIILEWNDNQDGDAIHRFHEYGDPTMAESVYMIECFKTWLINVE